ncbi:MAG: hypothetical protein E7126_02060 [Rikenellaceae bacterium]|nr:hypothetical protein [Rikenellaceae bacterium]
MINHLLQSLICEYSLTDAQYREGYPRVANTLVKFSDQTGAFIRSSNLPADVVKLYIRKARESFRTRTVEAL